MDADRSHRARSQGRSPSRVEMLKLSKDTARAKARLVMKSHTQTPHPPPRPSQGGRTLLACAHESIKVGHARTRLISES